MMHIVEICHRRPQSLNTCCRTIFSACHRDVDFGWASERAFDVVVDLGGALSQVRPFLGLLCESVLVGAFCAPYYTGGGASGVEAGVGAVAFVRISELAMDLGVGFCGGECQFKGVRLEKRRVEEVSYALTDGRLPWRICSLVDVVQPCVGSSIAELAKHWTGLI